ncbi:hypothetical protein P7K49_016087 [Saguinus oedipus]|uniref:Uncharacterized protein n=1 Tax=Saguinus oedipus TaxID=9490 RepID=A0ABQ9VB34_SAGOE|nr:hypothetical protein P7K49_016087 [Saguinus oedipus]
MVLLPLERYPPPLPPLAAPPRPRPGRGAVGAQRKFQQWGEDKDFPLGALSATRRRLQRPAARPGKVQTPELLCWRLQRPPFSSWRGKRAGGEGRPLGPGRGVGGPGRRWVLARRPLKLRPAAVGKPWALFGPQRPIRIVPGLVRHAAEMGRS